MSSANKPQLIIVEGEIGAGKSTLIKGLVPVLSASAKVFVCREPVDQWEKEGLLQEMYAGIDAIMADKTSRAQQSRLKMAESELESCSSSSDDDDDDEPSTSPQSVCSERSPSPPREKKIIEPLATINSAPGGFQVYAFATRIALFMPIFRQALDYAAAHPDERVVLIAERSVFTDRAVFKHMLVQSGFIDSVMSRVYDSCWQSWQIACAAPPPDLCVFVDTTVNDGIERIRARSRKGEENIDRGYETALWKRHQELFVDETSFEGAPIMRVDGAERFHDDPSVLSKVAQSMLTALSIGTRSGSLLVANANQSEGEIEQIVLPVMPVYAQA